MLAPPPHNFSGLEGFSKPQVTHGQQDKEGAPRFCFLLYPQPDNSIPKAVHICPAGSLRPAFSTRASEAPTKPPRLECPGMGVVT